METKRTKLKIITVGPVQTSTTVKTTTKKVVLTVVEIPTSNPFGHNKETAASFDVEVYNHNIETFNINSSMIGEVADCELVITHYKRDSNSPSVPKFIVNDLTFRI